MTQGRAPTGCRHKAPRPTTCVLTQGASHQHQEHQQPQHHSPPGCPAESMCPPRNASAGTLHVPNPAFDYIPPHLIRCASLPAHAHF
eukprot:scaffold221623_cov19-Tisochrysis_lutea.AAC.1